LEQVCKLHPEKAFRNEIQQRATVTQMRLYRRRGRRVSSVMSRRDTERRGEFLIILQVNVVDAHFASLNTIHYLLKVWVFDLQSITYQ
jgi:hypothetical protein